MRASLAVLCTVLPVAASMYGTVHIGLTGKLARRTLLVETTDPRRGPEEVISVQQLIARSRERSRAEGRKGCCYKASDYLSQTASGPPASSSWAREVRDQPRVTKTPGVEPLAPPDDAIQRTSRFSLLSQLSTAETISYQARDSQPIYGKRAPKYCKFDAVRESLAASRARRPQGYEPWRPS
mmetsp:Transcript_14141/g.43243  ORF Transcript_14141/g.43243 Transcript_14141/m.43243 type:complete len:182 (-) Transcript_14141:345-890(-)